MPSRVLCEIRLPNLFVMVMSSSPSITNKSSNLQNLIFVGFRFVVVKCFIGKLLAFLFICHMLSSFQFRAYMVPSEEPHSDSNSSGPDLLFGINGLIGVSLRLNLDISADL